MADRTFTIRVHTQADLDALRATGVALDVIETEANQAAAATRAVGSATRKVGQRNNARGILELSRAFEDLQFGIRGVLNNIPGTLQAFGVGAGAAGIVSIMAVSAEAIRRFIKSAREAKEATEDLSLDSVTALQELSSELDEVAKKYDRLSQAAQDAADDQSSDIKIAQQRIDIALEERKLDLRGQRISGKIGTDKELRDRIREAKTAALVEKALVEEIKESAELADSRKLLALAIEEEASKEEIRAAAEQAIADRVDQREADRARLPEAKAELATARARPDTDPDAKRRRDALKEEIEAIKDRIIEFIGDRDDLTKAEEEAAKTVDEMALEVARLTPDVERLRKEMQFTADLQARELEQKIRLLQLGDLEIDQREEAAAARKAESVQKKADRDAERAADAKAADREGRAADVVSRDAQRRSLFRRGLSISGQIADIGSAGLTGRRAAARQGFKDSTAQLSQQLADTSNTAREQDEAAGFMRAAAEALRLSAEVTGGLTAEQRILKTQMDQVNAELKRQRTEK